MTIEATLQSIDDKLGTLIGLFQNGQVLTGSGIAGAGAEPAVAKQVADAINAAGGASGSDPVATQPAPAQKRGRGRPAKTETAPPAAQTAPAAPAVPAADPFAIDGGAVDTGPTRTLNDVRAALIVYQAKHGQAEAIKLMKDSTGAETLAQLKEADYGKLFRAAIPADRIDIADVRLILVKANERVANSGLEVLKKFGANTLVDLKDESKYADVILAAHAVK